MIEFRPRVFPVSFSQSLRSASDAARLFDPIGSPLKLPRHGDEPVGGRAQGHHHVRRCGARRRRRTAVRSARVAARRQLEALVTPGVAAPVTVDDLLAARKAAARLGGTDRAIAALIALKKLD